MAATKTSTEPMTDFSRFKSTSKLKALAAHPFDLTKEGNLTPQRITKFFAESCGYNLYYGTERITEEVMGALVELAHEANALNKMQRMQEGEVMNFIEGYPSENRPVLHTAVRDFFNHPHTASTAAEATKRAKHEIDKLKKFMEQLDRDNKFTDLICIAIGGSDLGPKANFEALKHLLKKGRRVFFLSNVDPDEAAATLRQANLNKALVVVVSKSGTTLETATNEAIIRDAFVKAGLKPEEHFVSATSEGSPMDNKKNYLESFHIWDWVGGRFSTSSMIGGVMFSFAFGFDIYWEILRGANAMDKAALNQDISKNLPLLSALLGIWNRNFLHYPVLAVVPYSQALWRYAAHIQQVDMESNGKRIDQHGKPVDFATGPIVMGEPGTAAQHSFYQLLHQGTDIVPMELIGFKESQYGYDLDVKGTTSQQKLLANLFAQSIALATGKTSSNPNTVFPGNRPSHLILGKKLTPFALGALLAYFEHKFAFQGFIWGINSFDQEGVQLGKELANKIIDRFQGKGTPYPLGDTYLGFLDRLK